MFPEDMKYWSEGGLLVMAKDASLPDRCIRCNAPAHQRVQKTFSWHSPFLYLLILAGILTYIVVAIFVRHSIKVELPLCERHARRHRKGVVLVWVGFLGTFLVPIGGHFLGGLISEDFGMYLAIGSVPVMLATLAFGQFLATVTRVKKVDHMHGWFTVDEGFLAECPESQMY